MCGARLTYLRGRRCGNGASFRVRRNLRHIDMLRDGGRRVSIYHNAQRAYARGARGTSMVAAAAALRAWRCAHQASVAAAYGDVSALARRRSAGAPGALAGVRGVTTSQRCGDIAT